MALPLRPPIQISESWGQASVPALLTLRWLTGAGRRGSLPLQDLIRDLNTDDLDQQNPRVGAGRCAGPSNEMPTRKRGQAWKPAPTGPHP